MSKSKIFKDNQYHDLADQLLEQAKALNKEYWALSKKIAETSYPVFMDQMEDAQRLGKLAQAIRELQTVNSTLRHITGIF